VCLCSCWRMKLFFVPCDWLTYFIICRICCSYVLLVHAYWMWYLLLVMTVIQWNNIWYTVDGHVRLKHVAWIVKQLHEMWQCHSNHAAIEMFIRAALVRLKTNTVWPINATECLNVMLWIILHADLQGTVCIDSDVMQTTESLKNTIPL
jgi:hypothetical protein